MIATIKRILKYTKPYKGFLLSALILALVSTVLTLLSPVLAGRAIDYIVGKGQVNFPILIKYIVIIVITVILGGFFQWLMNLCINKAAYKTVNDIRTEAFDKLSRLPLSYIDRHSHGDIITRIANDADQISDGLIQSLTQMFTGLVTIMGTLGFMLSINLKIAVVVILLTPLSMIAATFITKNTQKHFSRQSTVNGELGGYANEIFASQKAVIAFSYQNNTIDNFGEINDRLYRCGVKAQFFSALTNPTTRFINAVIYASVCVFGAVSALSGGMSVGQLSCFLSYANQYTKPFNDITSVFSMLQLSVASASRVFELIDEKEELSDENNAELTDCDGSVEFNNVSFSYLPDRPLIDDFNLKVKNGMRIAIVGPTGCGKTTLINLLMRFYDVKGGEILVSGKNINAITRKSLRRNFGMVLQNTWLFKGSVRDNIAFGKPDATDEEIITAAKTAHAHRFIMQLEKGYDTVISESGGSLSEGQKQLLCIARIMLTDPRMLILDEATSNIDTRTELRIQRAFKKLMNGRTSFIVAHRLSTIKEADCIIVMKDGHIIEQGNHKSLIDKGGFYKNLYESQFKES